MLRQNRLLQFNWLGWALEADNELLNMRAVGDPELKIYGIFGFPLGHTASPAIQNCAFDYYKLKSFYFAFERPPARFRFLMRNLKSLLLEGFNVTVPFKETVIPYLDRLSPEAKAVGAVNTVKKEKGKWVGYNTDVHGFLAGLKEAKFNLKGKAALILGAGGSACAVAYALSRSGVRRILVANRTRSRAESLVRKLEHVIPRLDRGIQQLDSRFRGNDKISFKVLSLRENDLKAVLSEVDLLINATKVGLSKNDGLLVPTKAFPKRKILVYDLIYKPAQTKLLRTARILGHKVINGEAMLLHQGAKAFEIWTGKPAPIHIMRKVLHDAIHSN